MEDDGILTVPEGCYLLENWVSIGKNKTIIGNPSVTFRALSHYAGLDMPEIPNRVKLINVTVDYTFAKGKIDPVQWFTPDQNSPINNAEKWGGPGTQIGNEIAHHYKDGSGAMYFVKGRSTDHTEYWKWDRSNLYYVYDDSGQYGFTKAIMVTRDTLIPTFRTYTGQIKHWHPDHNCKNQSVDVQTHPFSIISHSMIDFGGQVGWADAVVLRHGKPTGQHNPDCLPSNGNSAYEQFYGVRKWGRVRWEDYCGDGTPHWGPVYWTSTTGVKPGTQPTGVCNP